MPNTKAKCFLASIVTLGVFVCCVAVYFLPLNTVDWKLFLLAAITILFASRLSIQFPGSKVHFLMGDALVFLAFLLYGGEAAILLAGAEAFSVSFRLKRQGVFAKYSTVLRNTAVVICSTAATYAGVLIYAHSLGRTIDYNDLTDFFTLLSVMALVQFFANSFLTALIGALKGDGSFRQIFLENCLGSSVIYIAGAAFAGIAYKLIQHFNFFAVALAAVIVALLYRTYQQYLDEIKLRRQQTVTAERERDAEQQRRIEETERHLVELQQSQQMLQSVINNVPQHIFWKDRNSVYIGGNRSFAAAAGLAAPVDVCGKTDHDLIWQSEAEMFHRSDRKILGGDAQFHVREQVYLADGSCTWFDTHKVPLFNQQNEIIGILGTSEDVTLQVKNEEEQRLLREQLYQAQKMESIGTLAGGIAHDFNNLLTVITISTQLAQRKLDADSPLMPRIADIASAADRAAALTRQLLAFGRRQTLERKKINLNTSICDTLKMLSRLIGEDIEVNVEQAADLAPVYADPQQLEQILMNLAVNARDAMPLGGRLTFKTENASVSSADCAQHAFLQPGDYVLMSVVDNGSGMSVETQRRIFEPFFTTKKIGEGTGLGLAVVYGIVKQHEGFIEVESQLGAGTVFKIYLPILDQSVADETPCFKPLFAGGTETILVAEDEPSLREIAGDVLSALGYRVLLAENGEEAVAIYKSRRSEIDLVLLDIVMPRQSGPEAYQQIKSFEAAAPVMFMTGYSEDVVQSKFITKSSIFKNANLTVIQKPYSVETLGSKIREMLDASRLDNRKTTA